MKQTIVLSLALLLTMLAARLFAAEGASKLPVVMEPSWRICAMPDLGNLAGPDFKRQHIVDHSFIQRADGKWLLWACIRGTKPGRVLWGWEGESLTNGPWRSLGLVARADAAFGEKVQPQESIQAPHFVRAGDQFLCFYNSGGIRLMTSPDGMHFTRRGAPPDGNLLYADGGRDVMVLPLNGIFHAYSTVSTTDGRGYIILRTSRDLMEWTPVRNVCEGGRGGVGPVSAESPFVVALEGSYYLFRASSNDGKTYVYRSPVPDDFGVDSDSRLVTVLKLKAPEIIQHAGEWFISDLADFKGITMRRLQWKQ